jgi:hypothetical protein
VEPDGSLDDHTIGHSRGAIMNRIRHVLIGAGAAVLLGTGSAAIAHHGWTGYHTEAQKLTGVIEQSTYASPHGSIRLKAGDKDWLVVLAPPSRMTNRGLTPEMLKVGTSVSVEGYQHKTEAGEMRAERITVDGKTVELR